jgi:hypothetical protein
MVIEDASDPRFDAFEDFLMVYQEEELAQWIEDAHAEGAPDPDQLEDDIRQLWAGVRRRVADLFGIDFNDELAEELYGRFHEVVLATVNASL